MAGQRQSFKIVFLEKTRVELLGNPLIKFKSQQSLMEFLIVRTSCVLFTVDKI